MNIQYKHLCVNSRLQGEDDGDVMDEDLARELAEMDSYGEETDALSLAHENASAAAATAAVADDNAAAGTSGTVDSKQLQEEKARVQQLMDEYFKLDYESTVGGLPCRYGASLVYTDLNWLVLLALRK